MSEYQEPIRISHDDPICSVSAMNGTVIGILFEKSGTEIRQAMQSRVDSIDAKIAEYRSKVDDTEKFLKGKVEGIEKLEEFYTERADAKRSLSKPFERQIDDIRKELQDKVFEFDKTTEKDMAGKALEFEKGFEDMQDNFKEINDILEKEQERSVVRVSKALRSHSTKCSPDSLNSDNSGFVTYNSANVGMGEDTPQQLLYVTQEEDEALAKLNTLKNKVRTYAQRVEVILGKIKVLEEEKRHLTLMQRHLDDNFKYKLDLNKLSAFGFEDLKVA